MLALEKEQQSFWEYAAPFIAFRCFSDGFNRSVDIWNKEP
jgi:hypothetical protein